MFKRLFLACKHTQLLYFTGLFIYSEWPSKFTVDLRTQYTVVIIVSAKWLTTYIDAVSTE